MSNQENTIKAKLIGLEVGGFSTKKDGKEFDKLCKGLWGFNKGITITPFYNEDGELMSFLVDSEKAVQLVKERLGNRA